MRQSWTTTFVLVAAVAATPLTHDLLAQDSTAAQRSVAAVNSQTQVPLIIPAGTPLTVALDRAVSSASVNNGDTVSFHMAADYSEYGHVLIAAGTRVHGVVSGVHRRKAGGVPGKVSVEALSVRTVDDQRVELDGSKGVKGKNRQSQAAVLGVLTVGLGGTKKGLSAVIPEGTQFTVYTATPVTVVVPR